MGVLIVLVSIIVDVLIGLVAYWLLGWLGLVLAAFIFIALGITFIILDRRGDTSTLFKWLAAPILLVLPLLVSWLIGWIVWQFGYIQAIQNSVHEWHAPQGDFTGLLLWVFGTFGWAILWMLGLATMLAGQLCGILAAYFLGEDNDGAATSAALLGIFLVFIGVIASGGMSAINHYYPV